MSPPGPATVGRWPLLKNQDVGPSVARLLSVLTALCIVAYVLPLGGLLTSISCSVLVYALAALGLNLTFGHGGVIDAGHALYFGASAYVVLEFAAKYPGTSILPAVLVGILLAVLLGLLVGLMARRVSGFFVVLSTLAVAGVASAAVPVIPGTKGLLGLVASADTVAGGVFLKGRGLLIALVICVVSVGYCSYRLGKSLDGLALAAIRASALHSACMGIRVGRWRYVVFVVGAGVTGLAGALFAILLGYMDPSYVGISASLQLLAIVIIGGVSTSWGPILGSILVIGIPDYFGGLHKYETLLMGIIFLIVLVRSGGLQAAFAKIVRGIGDRVRFDGPGRQVAEERAAGSDGDGTRASSRAVPGSEIVFQPQGRREATVSEVAGVPPGSPGLSVQKIAVSFGAIPIIRDVSLEVPQGQIHALVGPNGSGKTTTLNAISGLVRPQSGRMVLGDRELTGLRPDARVSEGLVRSFQLVSLVPSLSIKENIVLGCHMMNRRGRGDNARKSTYRDWLDESASEILERLQIGQFGPMLPATVPAGARRLAEVGRCLAQHPRVLLLDEPATGLNEAEEDRLCGVVEEVAARGVGVLLVEHSMRVVRRIADVVTVLDAGWIISVGSPAEVAADERVVEAYLGRTGMMALRQNQHQEPTEGERDGSVQ